MYMIIIYNIQSEERLTVRESALGHTVRTSFSVAALLAVFPRHPVRTHGETDVPYVPTMRAIDPPACTFNDRNDKSHRTERDRGEKEERQRVRVLAGLRWTHTDRASSTAQIIIQRNSARLSEEERRSAI